MLRVLGGQGATVEVPVPVLDDGRIPEFVHAMEFVQGAGTFNFVDSERGPALRVRIPPNGGQDIVLSSRQAGVQEATLTMEAGNGTHWMRSDAAPVTAILVFGHTRRPDCPQTALEHAFVDPGWVAVRAVGTSNCPDRR